MTLTPKQAELARWLRRGATYEEAAFHLGISVAAVYKRVELAARKLPGPGYPKDRLLQWAKAQEDQ